MGESALISHMKSRKHQDIVKHATLHNVAQYLVPKGNNSNLHEVPCEASEKSNLKENSVMASWVRNKDLWKAEILYVLKTVMYHCSYKSCEKNSVLFKAMFPDSEIARQFSCGERKTAYIVNHGLKPYFLNQLLSKAKSKDMFVLLFDEAMNQKLQLKQLDLHIRYYDETTQCVETHYLESAFMGHGRASDLTCHIKSLTQSLRLENLLQFSMDGPNVNLKFYKDFKTELDTDKELLDFGTCSLHKLHNVFQTGFKQVGWDLEWLLKCMHNLFKDSPARREDYVAITGSEEFPLKYCSHRWVENVPVATRALHVLPHIRNFIKTVQSDKKYSVPSSKSFQHLKESALDALTPVKLQFFISVASQMSPYLTKYQTDHPMVPFIADDMEKLIKELMQRVLEKDVLSQLKTKYKIGKYDLQDTDILQPTKIDIGFITEKALKAALLKKEITDREYQLFYLDCKKCLTSILRKLLDSNPLHYSLIRSASCFKPSQVANPKLQDLSCKQFRNLLTVVTNAKQFEERKCDDAVRQYKMLLNEKITPYVSKFQNFKHTQDRLDKLYSEILSEDKSYTELWFIIRLVLTLSHGQASVERGFSVNSKCSVENKKQDTYAAQRIVQDSVRKCGGIMNVNINDEMISYVKSARSKYEQYMEDNIQKEKKQQKRKQKEQLNAKIKRLKEDIEHLSTCAEKAAEEAEKTCNRECIIRFNTFRKAIKEKKSELHSLNSKP